MRSGKSYTVNGATRLYLGDSIFVVVKESEIGRVKIFFKERFMKVFLLLNFQTIIENEKHLVK